MNAFIDIVAKLPKWALPIIMVAPALIVALVLGYTNPHKPVIIGDQQVGLMVDPDTTDCENRGLLMKDGSGCVIRNYLSTGTHDVPEKYRVEIMELKPITLDFTIGDADE